MNTRRGAVVASIPFLAGMLFICWMVFLGAMRPPVANAMVSHAEAPADNAAVLPNHRSSAIDARAVDTTTVGAAGVSITPPSSEKYGDPGQAVIHNHTVTNDGGVPDTFNLSVDSSQGWTVSVSPNNLTLQPGMPGGVIVTVNIPPGALPGTIDTTTLTATSTEYKVEATATDTTTVRIVGVTINPPSASKDGDPGQLVTYNHTVQNTGNAADTFALTVSSSKGWTVSVNPSSLPLAAGASGTVVVRVNVPPSAAAGVKDITTLTATSGNNSSVKDTATDTTTVNLEAEVSVSPDSLSKEGSPGQAVVNSHTVTNGGNKSDIINLSVSSNKGWSVSVSPNQLTLGRGVSGTVQVTVQIPAQAASGVKDITTLTAASTNIPTVKDTALDTTTVSEQRLFLTLIVSAPEWGEVGSSTWTAGDAARSLAVCSDASTMVFAGARSTGGVYSLRLFNGFSWQTLNTGIPADKILTSLVANAACNTLYVGAYGSGVWEGTKGSADTWSWRQLGDGTAVSAVRTLALSGGVLFAGGDFGLRYWDGAAWQSSVGIPSGLIMDLAIGGPAQNQGPVYAVQWANPRVYVNSDPANAPGQWAEIGGIADLPSTTVLAAAGTTSSVRFVGTETAHYSLVAGNWLTVQERPGRSFAIDESVAYAGYADGSGIYKSGDDGLTFEPANDGFATIPASVYEIIRHGGDVYAATSSGVFKR